MKNMKKILCGALVAIVPLVLISGCGSDTFYTKAKTNSTAPSFLYSINNNVETFETNLASRIQDGLTLQQPGGDGATTQTIIPFDITDYQNDEPAQNLLNKQILDFAKTINKQGVFASSFFQMAKAEQGQGYCDMSFLACGDLTQAQKTQLKEFFVQTESKTDNQTVYKHKLTGLEVDEMNLPVQVVSRGDFVDDVDSAIKEWGNYLLFEVNKQSSGATRIKIYPTFAAPTIEEVTISLNNYDLTDCTPSIENYLDNNVEKQMVVVRYEESTGDEFTKTIEFINNGTTVQKKITKYVGYEIDVQYLLNSYTYTFDVGANSTLDVTGEYTINYDPLHSYISVYESTNKTRLEYFKVDTGELIGRLSTIEKKARTVINVIIDNNLETGMIKYDYQTNTTDYVKLGNEESLTNAFCKITEEERSIATTKPGVEILNYTITATKIAIERANVIKEK